MSCWSQKEDAFDLSMYLCKTCLKNLFDCIWMRHAHFILRNANKMACNVRMTISDLNLWHHTVLLVELEDLILTMSLHKVINSPQTGK